MPTPRTFPGEQRALRRDPALGQPLARDAKVTLRLVTESVVKVACPNDNALARLRARYRAARFDGHDVGIARDEPVLGREARAVEPGLLGSGADRVHGVRAPLVPP